MSLSPIRTGSLALTVAASLAAGALQAQGTSRIAVIGPEFLAISVPDIDASARWYGDLFGLTADPDMMSPDSSVRVRILRSPSLIVELLADRRAKPRAGASVLEHGFVKMGLFVPNLDSAVAVLRARGVALEGLWLQSRPRNLMVRDKAGNLLQISERP